MRSRVVFRFVDLFRSYWNITMEWNGRLIRRLPVPESSHVPEAEAMSSMQGIDSVPSRRTMSFRRQEALG